MRMNNTSKRKPKSNVLAFPEQNFILEGHPLAYPSPPAPDDYSAYSNSRQVFGYAPDTLFISREKFKESEITSAIPVVTIEGEIAAGQTEKVRAVVDFIQISLRGAI